MKRVHPGIKEGDRFGKWEAVEQSDPKPRPHHWPAKVRCGGCGSQNVGYAPIGVAA